MAKLDHRTPRRPTYEEFRAAYPAGHFDLDETKIKTAFGRLSPKQRAHVFERLEVYLVCGRWQEDGGKWIPKASNWLPKCDEEPPAVITKSKAKAPAPPEDDPYLKMRRDMEAKGGKGNG